LFLLVFIGFYWFLLVFILKIKPVIRQKSLGFLFNIGGEWFYWFLLVFIGFEIRQEIQQKKIEFLLIFYWYCFNYFLLVFIGIALIIFYCYWFLLGFIGFYWFYWFRKNEARNSTKKMIKKNWVFVNIFIGIALINFIGLYWFLLVFIGFENRGQWFSKKNPVLLVFLLLFFYWFLLVFIGLKEKTEASISAKKCQFLFNICVLNKTNKN